MRRRERRTLLSSLNSWRQEAKLLEEVDMVFISLGGEMIGRKGKDGVSYSLLRRTWHF